MASIRIQLFNNLSVACGGEAVATVNTNRLQSLLAYLVLHAGAPQSREQLAYRLWPESSEPQARTNLRQLLHHLRRALPTEACLLEADNQTVLWRRDAACVIDVVEFESAIAQAAEAARSADAAAECGALEQAVLLYQDDLLRGLYDDWLQPHRARYRQQLTEALSRLVALCEARAEFPAAIRHAERLVALDPLSEVHHQKLLRLHAANHDRASALRAYHQCKQVLRRELAVDPGAATRALFEQILRSEAPPPARVELPPATTSAPAPMVGRTVEWQRLQEAWQQIAHGGVHLAVILGEPGIGKSRLADRLYQQCVANGAAVARARCYAAQGRLAYAPIAGWLRAEPLRAACAQLQQAQLAELASALPEILTDNPAMERPAPLTESWERRHFYASLNAAFGKAAKPLLLLIDDLQWCDADSFEWLHTLFGAEPDGGILILGTARPEETGRTHPFTRLLSELRVAGQALELPLAPLDAEETAALGAQVANHPLDSADSGTLYRATKGNPLFVVESVRAGLGNSAATAPRIHAVIAARLAQLSAPAYELAGFAAAIGRAFSFDLLAKATDWDEDSLSAALDELWQRRIVGGQGEDGGASLYDFTHDRLREVAYADLSPVLRRFLHRRVARALEELHAAETEGASAQLAAHYEAAGMVEPAIGHFRRAAAVARQRFADAEAAGLLRRALALCREFPESTRRDEQELELLVTLGPVLVTTHGYSMPEVGETYARALELSRKLGDTPHVFPVLSGAWVFHVVRGQMEVSRELGQQCLDLAIPRQDATLSVMGHFILGSSNFHLGRLVEADVQMERAMAAYEGRSHPALMLFAGPDVGVFCRSYQSHMLWLMGRGELAAQRSAEALAAAAEVGHPFSRAIALDYAAMLHLFRGERAAALACAEDAAAVCRKHEFAYYLTVAEIVAGAAAEDGIARIRQGMEALKAMGAEIRLPFYHGLLAEACVRAGQIGEGLANLSNGFAFQSKNGEVWAAPELHRIHAELLLRNGNPEEAWASYERALAAARQSGARMWELRAALGICRLRRSAETLVTLRRLVSELEGGFDSPDLREARGLLAVETGSERPKPAL